MSNDNTQDAAEPSPASAGSQPVAWAVVNPSGGTRFLGLTQEDAQRVATASERVRPVYWPTLTDEEREAIKTAIEWLTTLSSRRREIHSADLLLQDARTLRGLLDRLT